MIYSALLAFCHFLHSAIDSTAKMQGRFEDLSHLGLGGHSSSTLALVF